MVKRGQLHHEGSEINLCSLVQVVYVLARSREMVVIEFAASASSIKPKRDSLKV